MQGAEINEAKIVLATEATTMLHGREAAVAAEQTARQTFEGGGAGEDLPTLSLGDGMNIAHILTATRLHPVEQGSEAQDRRRGSAARR